MSDLVVPKFDVPVVEEKPSESSCVEFNLHSCYYNDFFLLRTPITINGRPAEIKLAQLRSGTNKGSPYLCDEKLGVKLTLSNASKIVEYILSKHGVYRIDTFYYDKVPMFSVQFRLLSDLKEFLSRIEEIQSEIAAEISGDMQCHLASDPKLAVHQEVNVNMDAQLFLVSPDRCCEGEDDAAKVYRITLATVTQGIEKWQSSVLFGFQPHLFDTPCEFSMNKQHIKVEKVKLQELQKELYEVSEWFALGIQLNISSDELRKIQRDNHYQTDDCRTTMLVRWEQLQTLTWTKVVQALNVIGRPLLAQRIAIRYGVDLEQVTSRKGQGLEVESSNSIVFEHEDLSITEQAIFSKEKVLAETKQQQECLTMCLEKEMTWDINELQGKLNSSNEEIALLREKLSLREEEIKFLEEARKKMKRTHSDTIERMKKDVQERIRALNEQLKTKMNELAWARAQLVLKEKELDEKTKELELKSAEILKIQSELSELKHAFTSKKGELNFRLIQMEQLSFSHQNSLEEAQAQLLIAKEEIVNKKEAIENQRKVLASKEEQIEKLSVTAQKNERKMTELKRELEAHHLGAEQLTIEQFNEDNERAQQLCSLMISTIQLKQRLREAEEEKLQECIKLEKAHADLQCYKSMIPDISKCKANLTFTTMDKHQDSQFQVFLFDKDGYPCTGHHSIGVELTSSSDRSIAAGKVSEVMQDKPGVYTVVFTPTKAGSCDILVNIDGTPLVTGPFTVHIQNYVDIKNCYAKLPDAANVLTNIQFQVVLLDEDGDPCIGEHSIQCHLVEHGNESLVSTTSSTGDIGVFTLEYTPVKCGWQNIMVTIDSIPLPNAPFKVFILPSHPLNVRACPAGVTNTTISVEWSKPEYGSEYVMFYTVDYIENDACKWRTFKTNGNETSFSIIDLQPEKAYRFKVIAQSEVGSSMVSTVSEPIMTKSDLQYFTHTLESQLPKLVELIGVIHSERLILKEYQAKMQETKDFHYDITVTKQRKVDLPTGTYVLICLICNMSCMESVKCHAYYDDEKWKLSVMRGNRDNAHCTACPKKCDWKQHILNNYKFEIYQVVESRTSEDLRTQYLSAMDSVQRTSHNISSYEKHIMEMLNIEQYFHKLDTGVIERTLQTVAKDHKIHRKIVDELLQILQLKEI